MLWGLRWPVGIWRSCEDVGACSIKWHPYSTLCDPCASSRATRPLMSNSVQFRCSSIIEMESGKR